MGIWAAQGGVSVLLKLNKRGHEVESWVGEDLRGVEGKSVGWVLSKYIIGIYEILKELIKLLYLKTKHNKEIFHLIHVSFIILVYVKVPLTTNICFLQIDYFLFMKVK